MSATTGYHFRTKRSHNDVPWIPPFMYECSNGHSLRADAECCVCPACIHGVPCEGTLTRVGPGSKPRKVTA